MGMIREWQSGGGGPCRLSRYGSGSGIRCLARLNGAEPGWTLQIRHGSYKRPGMTPDRQNEPGEPGLAVAGWHAGSFTISTAAGGVVAVALAFTDWIAALTD